MDKQTFNPTLHNQLPAKILASREIMAVNSGTVPPYIIYEADGMLTGAAVELFAAISEILGITIKYEVIGGGFAGVLMGIQSGRYDLNVGPMGDTIERRAKLDLIAYTISYDAATVLKGNSANIHTWDDFCGKRAGAISGALGEKLLTARSERCISKGEAPITMLMFKDYPSMVLALKAGRIDAFTAGVALSAYFVGRSNETLETVSLHKEDESFRYFCAAVAKDSPLGPIILAALEELYANGTYDKIMDKWHMQAAKLDKPGINLAK